MTKKGHQAVGLALGIVLFSVLKEPLVVAGCLVGSTLPDIDYRWGFRKSAFSHRGITHSLLLSLILLIAGFTAFVVLKNPAGNFLLGLSGGYLSHVLVDAMSPTARPSGFTYYPRFRLKTLYRTGDISEFFVAVGILIAAAGISAVICYLEPTYGEKAVKGSLDTLRFLEGKLSALNQNIGHR